MIELIMMYETVHNMSHIHLEPCSQKALSVSVYILPICVQWHSPVV